MRLAGTATPLRRESARPESNQRSPAPRAGGVANSPTASRHASTPGGIRTRSFRIESPASFPVRPQGLVCSEPNLRLVMTAADAGFAGVGHPRPEPKRITDRSHQGSAKPSRTSIGYSGGRDRTCASRSTVARLTRSTTPERRRKEKGVEPPVRQALSHVSYPPLTRRRRCRLRRVSHPGRNRQGAYPIEVIMAPRSGAGLRSGNERCFSCHSPTLQPWIDGSLLAERRPTWRSFGARFLSPGWKCAG